ncbi:MAG: STAS domain-containing protein [Flavobacteriales bacterium]
MNFKYTINQKDGIPVISVKGSLLSMEIAEPLLMEVDNIAGNGTDIIIDMAGMDYLNSTGLSVLIKILTKMRNAGGEVIIASVPDAINHLLIITKINSVFKVLDSISEALDFIKSARKTPAEE